MSDSTMLVATEAKARIEALEGRFDQHLIEMNKSVNKLFDKIDDLTTFIHELDKNQVRQDSKTLSTVIKYGGSGMLGGGIITGLLEIIKSLIHK